ncbi:MAG: secretin N-terminal domain-containing protein [Armatimonadota bacterium]
MPRTIASLLLCLLVLSLGNCIFAAPDTAPATAEKGAGAALPPIKGLVVIRVFPLRYANAREMQMLLESPTNHSPTSNPNPFTRQGSVFHDLLPGLQSITAAEGRNALIVTASNNQEIDQFVQLLKHLDQPRKHLTLTVTLVEVELKVIDETFKEGPISTIYPPDGDGPIYLVGGDGKKRLEKVVAEKKARVLATTKSETIEAGSGDVLGLPGGNGLPVGGLWVNMATIHPDNSITLDFSTLYSPPAQVTAESKTKIENQTFSKGIEVNNVTIHPDDSVTLDVTPQLEGERSLQGVLGGNEIVRLKSGDSILVSVAAPPFAPETKPENLYLMITPTVLKDNKAATPAAVAENTGTTTTDVAVSPVTPTTTVEPVIKKVIVQHHKVAEIQYRLAALAITGKDQRVVIPGIQDIIPLNGLNAFLIKGEKEAANLLAVVIHNLDQPQKAATLEVMYFIAKTDWALAQGFKRTAKGTWELPSPNDGTKYEKPLREVFENGEAEVLNAPLIHLQSFHDQLCFRLNGERSVGLVVKEPVINADDTITFRFVPLFGAPGFNQPSQLELKKPITVKKDKFTALAIYANRNPASDTIAILFVRPAISDANEADEDEENQIQ